MKKQFCKILACTLSLILLLSCGVPVFAATKETVVQYGTQGGYLAIGDSISRGCGAEGFYLDEDGTYLPNGEGQYGLYHLRNVKGCVPYQIAQAVGCTAPEEMTDQDATYWPFTYPGMTTAVTLDLLGVDDGFKDEKLNYAYYKDMLQYFGYEGSFDGVREGDTYVEGECGQCGNIIELIQRADLITVQLGMCDVFYRAYRVVSNGGMLADGLNIDVSNLGAIKDLVQTAITEIKFGFDYWKEHYTMLLDKIVELNPDATVVIVGAFNLVNQLTITDDLLFPLGSVISGITDSMNRYYRKWAKEYGMLYADIANTETLATENDWSIMGEFKDNTFTGTHPSQTGYDYITRQILAQLPEKSDNKNLRVDLGRFSKVDYVLINGIPIKNYTMEDYLLTIPYSGPLVGSLVIGVKNDDGTISVQNYELTWRAGEGTTAYRVWGNNDAVGTAKKPFTTFVKLIRQLFEKIVNGLKKLFKKD
ncbi:MAG: hypothetical protein IJT27_05110 [Clostridia bacterium]|nr:hypothetical protein [Clostridia bacterium]